MNLPTQHRDVWKPATDGDKLRALAMLGTLPSRKALSGEVEDAAYAIVMDGMTAHGLEEAVRAALRGEHGSTFFPSPPELKSLHDKAMEHHVRMRERISHQAQIERERREYAPRVEHGPEARARVAALTAAFHASHERAKNDEFEKERGEIRARYGMTPELLAQVPSAELAKTWRKAG